jgi:tRNA uridine 5-carboxymethylaminomethyl modification enzyme
LTTSKGRVTAAQALRQPDVRLEALMDRGDVSLETSPGSSSIDLASVEISLKFEGYLARQQQAVERAKRQEIRRIPGAFPYRCVPGLSAEMVHRFEQVRPATLGQALRIPGVTPAAVAIIGAYVDRFANEHARVS